MTHPANINTPETGPAPNPPRSISIRPIRPIRPTTSRQVLLQTLFSVLLPLLSGCGGETPAPEPPPTAESTPEAAASPEAGQVTMKDGAEFYLYDKRIAVGGAEKPMVSIQAAEFSLGTGDVASYAFKNVKATLHLADGKDIIFEAAEGSFVEGVEAYLKGGVRAQVNEMKIELEDIELSAPRVDAPGIAFSDHPVLVAAPGIEIRAAGLRLYPDEKKLELNSGSGYFDFGRFQK